LQKLTERYSNTISELTVPKLQLGYLDNLNGILDEESRNKQLIVFSSIKEELDRLEFRKLNKERQYQYHHLNYRLDMQLTRISLENRFKNIAPKPVDATTGIFHQPLGKEWYQYFLDNWISEHKTPEELFGFGEAEVQKVLAQIQEVQKLAGFSDDADSFYRYLNDDKFILKSEKEVIESYHQRQAIVESHLGDLFKVTDIPDVKIQPFPESHKDTPPGQLGFSSGLTFYFNFFNGHHNIQDMDFLYLHEVVPGHAYHFAYDQDFTDQSYSPESIFTYHGLSEGWGAYVEELGEELGLYQTPYFKMGKMKFDLVRSIRVAIDVGINHFGWDNQQALDYWHQYIKGQDQIAQREIDRVRRWPGQAISYKVGAEKILALRALTQEKLGQDFDIREFHHQILAHGGVPLSLVEKRILDSIQ